MNDAVYAAKSNACSSRPSAHAPGRTAQHSTTCRDTAATWRARRTSSFRYLGHLRQTNEFFKRATNIAFVWDRGTSSTHCSVQGRATYQSSRAPKAHFHGERRRHTSETRSQARAETQRLCTNRDHPARARLRRSPAVNTAKWPGTGAPSTRMVVCPVHTYVSGDHTRRALLTVRRPNKHHAGGGKAFRRVCFDDRLCPVERVIELEVCA
jgi:hypothetical protein